MITHREIRVVKQQGCRRSHTAVCCFLGVIACILFSFVPDAEGIFVFELRAAHHAHAPHVATPHLHIRISTSEPYLTVGFQLPSKAKVINISAWGRRQHHHFPFVCSCSSSPTGSLNRGLRLPHIIWAVSSSRHTKASLRAYTR